MTVLSFSHTHLGPLTSFQQSLCRLEYSPSSRFVPTIPFAYPSSSLSLGISMTFVLGGSHTTLPPICTSVAPLCACTHHRIVFVLFLEYFWHVAFTFRSFVRRYFLDSLYSSPFFFLYRTSKFSSQHLLYLLLRCYLATLHGPSNPSSC
jgi:hypothetical protein